MYAATVKADSNKQMVEIKSLAPNIVYDLKYATDKNFMRRNMYPGKTNYTFLRLPAARALAQVQKELTEKGLDAPRLSPTLINETIVTEQYYVFPGTVTTVCCLTLKNGIRKL